MSSSLEKALTPEEARIQGLKPITYSFSMRQWEYGSQALDILKGFKDRAPERGAALVRIGINSVEVWAKPISKTNP